MTVIESYFGKGGNSHSREKMLNHYICLELEKAAARCGYELQIYKPDTDHVGVDLIFDDMRTIKSFQLKSVLSKSSTATWKIHKRLIKPRIENFRNFGISVGGMYGLEGGVILLVVEFDSLHDDFMISIEYFDIYILKLFANRIIDRNNYSVYQSSLNVFRNFHYKNDSSVLVPRSLFVKVKDAKCLLGISGLYSDIPASPSFRFNTKEMTMWLKPENANEEKMNPRDLFDLFSELIIDDNIHYSLN